MRAWAAQEATPQGGAKMSFTLPDALSHYRATLDKNHKFWGYFQLVASATAAFAWSRDRFENGQLLLPLAAAFAVFAILNWRLVVESQEELLIAARCVKDYASKIGVPDELLPMIQAIKPDSTLRVGVWHAVLSMATLAAVIWAHCGLEPLRN